MIRDYKYIALTGEGKRIKGALEAPSKKALAQHLYDKGLTVVEISEYSNFASKLSKITFGRTIKEGDLIFILKQVSSMMKAGMRVVDAFEVLSSQTQQKVIRRILSHIYFELSAGSHLSDAMGLYPKDFPPLLVNMIKNGEESGDIINTIDNVASYYEQNREIRGEILGALTTPAVYILMAIGVSIMIVTVVLPNYVSLFESTNVEMPLPTQILLDVSYFVFDYGLYILAILVSLALTFYFLVYRTEKGRMAFGIFITRMPVFGQVVIMFNLSMIASTLSQMVSNHVHLLDAIKSTERIIKNAVYQERMRRIAANVENGYPISKAMENHFAFTPIFTKMISLGERSGSLDEMLDNLASYYSKDVKVQITRLRKRVEPMLMIFIYGLVGGLVMAVLLPSFSMMEAI